jgi:uncharacterized membrane protein
MTKALLFVLGLFIAVIAKAQATVPAESEGFMRSNGKIYVVVAIVLTILAGLIMYLVSLDRKISKLEKEQP